MSRVFIEGPTDRCEHPTGSNGVHSGKHKRQSVERRGRKQQGKGKGIVGDFRGNGGQGQCIWQNDEDSRQEKGLGSLGVSEGGGSTAPLFGPQLFRLPEVETYPTPHAGVLLRMTLHENFRASALMKIESSDPSAWENFTLEVL